MTYICHRQLSDSCHVLAYFGHDTPLRCAGAGRRAIRSWRVWSGDKFGLRAGNSGVQIWNRRILSGLV